jgi:hypothetical protein
MSAPFARNKQQWGTSSCRTLHYAASANRRKYMPPDSWKPAWRIA